jgi:hypothetical protein
MIRFRSVSEHVSGFRGPCLCHVLHQYSGDGEDSSVLSFVGGIIASERDRAKVK